MQKLLNFLLIVTFHLGYLEWGEDNSSFIFQAEGDIVQQANGSLSGIMHPLIIIPAIGVVLLLITLFQNPPGRKLTYLGTACLGILMVVLLVIGVLGMNWRVAGSTLPFWLVVSIVFWRMRRSHGKSAGQSLKQ